MYCPQCKENKGNFVRDCARCGTRLLPGRMQEAPRPNGPPRRISLRPSPVQEEPAPPPEPQFMESENPLAEREVGELTLSDGFPGQELLELLEFTCREIVDATEALQLERQHQDTSDPSSAFKLITRIRNLKMEIEKRALVRMDIARLQWEEFVQKESKPVVESLGRRCRHFDHEIKLALERLRSME